MPEPRISPTAGPNTISRDPISAGGAARAAQSTRWRDIRWVEFEPAPAEPIPSPLAIMPEPVSPALSLPMIANSNEPLADKLSAPAAPPLALPGAGGPPAARVPRYGRAIAPLPRHLIASVPAPARDRVAPAAVKLRPPTVALGSKSVLRTPFPLPRRGRGLRLAAVALIVAVVGLVVYRSNLVAGFAAAPMARLQPHPAVVVPLKETVALTAPASPTPVTAAAPAPPPAPASADRIAYLMAQAKAGNTTAQYALAVMYAHGDGVSRNYATAASWFREAAIAGNTAAQYNLAVLYERGLGLGQNMNEALIWYHSAAARNYPTAEYNLALSYAEGRGTPQDMVAAARWYRRAAEQGVVAAMVNFAILCENGSGTERSPSMAYAWYRAAGARDDDVAGKRADELLRQFSADDRKAAEAAAIAAAGSIHEPAMPPTTPALPIAAPSSAGLPAAQTSG